MNPYLFLWHCAFNGLCKRFKKWLLTPQGLRSIKPRGDFFQKIRITQWNLTKIENIVTHWSVVQAGSNDEKNRRPKISLDCPFKLKVQCHENSSQTWVFPCSKIASQVFFILFILLKLYFILIKKLVQYGLEPGFA